MAPRQAPNLYQRGRLSATLRLYDERDENRARAHREVGGRSPY